MLNAIYMVNDFSFSKVSSKFFFHYKAMLKHVVVWFYSMWVVPTKNVNIPSHGFRSPTFPKMGFFSDKSFLCRAFIRAKSHSFMKSDKFIFTFFAFKRMEFLPPRMEFIPLIFLRNKFSPSSIGEFFEAFLNRFLNCHAINLQHIRSAVNEF